MYTYNSSFMHGVIDLSKTCKLQYIAPLYEMRDTNQSYNSNFYPHHSLSCTIVHLITICQVLRCNNDCHAFGHYLWKLESKTSVIGPPYLIFQGQLRKWVINNCMFQIVIDYNFFG